MSLVRHYLGWLLAPLAPVLLWGACGDVPTIDNESGAARVCETDCDCYSEYNYELGTRCTGGLCLCPAGGQSPTPCCEKGNPLCNRQCRPIGECADADGGIDMAASSGAGGSAGGTGGGGGSDCNGGTGNVVPDPACKSAKDCPEPGDARCGEAQCVEGACKLKVHPLGKIASQIQGNCVSEYCDGAGNVVSLPDGEDVYNDGRQCTIDACKGGKPTNTPYPDSSPCPETGSGVCFDGECVACIASLVQCDGSFVCDYTSCVPMHCQNTVKEANFGETDMDCGGPCRPCLTGDTCVLGSDCADGVCAGNNCQPPSCSDGVTNDHETAIDCGGPPSCPRCAVGKTCQVSTDCQSGVCWVGVCEPSKCDDGLKNGDELDIDCGGPCPACS